MHIAPADLKSVRQDGLVLRFAMLGSMAFIFGEVPSSGSVGTSLERPCVRPHWGFVIEGELTYEAGAKRERITAGRAFHVPPGGPEHRFETTGPVLVAGFQPAEGTVDVTDTGLAAQGFEILRLPSAPTIVPALPRRQVPIGRVVSESWPMSGYVMTRARMGERSGFSAGWCDASHWGMVIDGRLTIEYEDDVEVLSTGEIFHCPGGPPGHRIQAADPAVFVDLTPVDAFDRGRISEWRHEPPGAPIGTSERIAVALR
jgi:quercetin dioxygenase-like cupin family protein